jgi:hypothetical protein
VELYFNSPIRLYGGVFRYAQGKHYILLIKSMKQGPFQEAVVVQLSKKFLVFYGTHRFITVFTKFRFSICMVNNLVFSFSYCFISANNETKLGKYCSEERERLK